MPANIITINGGDEGSAGPTPLPLTWFVPDRKMPALFTLLAAIGEPEIKEEERIPLKFCQYCGQPLEGHNAAMCDGDKGDSL